MTIEELKELLCEHGYETSVVFDGPDYANAFIGVDEMGRACYDYEKMVECLVEEDGMSEEDAMEFIGYNTERALPYAGPMAPVIIYTLAPDDTLTDNGDGTYSYRPYDYDNECLGDITMTITKLAKTD